MIIVGIDPGATTGLIKINHKLEILDTMLVKFSLGFKNTAHAVYEFVNSSNDYPHSKMIVIEEVVAHGTLNHDKIKQTYAYACAMTACEYGDFNITKLMPVTKNIANTVYKQQKLKLDFNSPHIVDAYKLAVAGGLLGGVFDEALLADVFHKEEKEIHSN